MADDTLLNPGIGGDLIVTDSLGGVPERKVQVVKLMSGASGVDGGPVSAANPLPVTGTVAATLSEPISVDDNGGSITVDVGTALPAGDNNIGNVDVVTLPALPAGTNNIGDVDVLTLPALPAGTNNIGDVDVLTLPALPAGNNNIGDVDIASDATLVVEDAAAAANPSGRQLMARARSASAVAAEVPTGDHVALNATLDGALNVRPPNKIASGAHTATGATQIDASGLAGAYVTIGGTFVGTVAFRGDSVTPIGGFPVTTLLGFNLSTRVLESQTTVPANYFVPIGGLTGFSVEVIAYTSGTINIGISGSAGTGAQHVTDGGGTLSVDDGAGSLTVDNAALSVVGNGAAAAALRVTLANDSTGVVAATVSQATAANLKAQVQGEQARDAAIGTNNPVLAGARAGTTAPSAVNADGDAVDLWANRFGSLQVGIRDAAGSDCTDAGLSAVRTKTQGNVAHDDAVSGNPVLIGLEARTSNPTAVANGDAVRAQADTTGRQVALIGSIPDVHGSGKVTLSNTSASDVLAAPGAGVRWVVTSIVITNASTSVSTKVEIRDGTSVIMQPHAEKTGGGLSLSNPSRIFHGTANTAITARNVTTSADVDVFISGYKEPG